ncbi:alpha/beta hydrolase family protein [Arenimonas donghaensis]|uniref:Xaa-Pro dipeptidyl-peptidase-like domain-containing protein n=1 Tax=Arenimonas donghaensis DSM 18148 = HO3-R19 TaxID=1121014 RepID=A0A087MFP7_9GAMM|nr:CocE/NonD family hydrolase [Arenimonas donghaensis]KFL35700.1 hypothetical protein N788_08155 [Arenimonas donghaensis DSM 18148 = HO3-R19]
MSILLPFPVLRVLILLLALSAFAGPAAGKPSAESFDGSFLLDTGELITGGYFVEDGKGRFLYMDTARLGKGGLFERTGDTRLRSILPSQAVELEFVAGDNATLDTLVWMEAGREPIRGARVHRHHSRPARFRSGDGTELQGRLLTPDCAGPHPVVVSVHGSGPVNRYGGPYQTFFLAQGLAVLAYDKRGYTDDRAAWREPGLAELSADVQAAVQWAATQPELDDKRLGVVGSSQAGWVVPRAAMAAPGAAFIILRAGAATSQLETVLHEVRQELRAKGMEGRDLDYAMDLRREIYETAMRGEPIDATDSLVAPYLDQPWYPTAFGEGPISRRWSPHWWAWARDNLAVAATPHLERFDGRVLWFLAGADENVPLVPTRAALERAFAASPGDDQRVVVLPGADHAFLLHDADGSPRFSPGYFDRMAAWLAERGLSRADCRQQ